MVVVLQDQASCSVPKVWNVAQLNKFVT